MAIPVQLITAALSAYMAIKAKRDREKDEKNLKKSIDAMPEYTESPYAKMALAQAQAQQNSINPAIASLYNQQQIGAANVAGAAQNYANSGGEAIQAAIAGQQIASQSNPQIAAMQNQYDMQNNSVLQNAQQNLASEGHNVYNSQIAKNDALQSFNVGRLKNSTSAYNGALQTGINSILASYLSGSGNSNKPLNNTPSSQNPYAGYYGSQKGSMYGYYPEQEQYFGSSY